MKGSKRSRCWWREAVGLWRFPQHGRLDINGVARTTGGVYDTVNIHGTARVNGDLECSRIDVHGMVHIHGGLKAERINVHGTCNIEGPIDSQHITVRGWAKFRGDCSAESLQIEGGFQTDGLLNAGEIRVQLGGPSRVREMGGGTLEVRSGRAMSLLRKIRLEAETIEGDDIYLENTRARAVRGARVQIGPGCHIDLVEYSGDFQQAKGSTVGQNRRVQTTDADSAVGRPARAGPRPRPRTRSDETMVQRESKPEHNYNSTCRAKT